MAEVAERPRHIPSDTQGPDQPLPIRHRLSGFIEPRMDPCLRPHEPTPFVLGETRGILRFEGRRRGAREADRTRTKSPAQRRRRLSSNLLPDLDLVLSRLFPRCYSTSSGSPSGNRGESGGSFRRPRGHYIRRYSTIAEPGRSGIEMRMPSPIISWPDASALVPPSRSWTV